MKFPASRQYGYTDLQIMPAMIGIVLLVVFLGRLDSLDPDSITGILKLALPLILATAVVCFGFGMHLYCLGYPESPFNRHSSPIFMTAVCSGAMFFAAWQCYQAGITAGCIAYILLGLVLIVLSGAFAIHRHNKNGTS